MKGIILKTENKIERFKKSISGKLKLQKHLNTKSLPEEFSKAGNCTHYFFNGSLKKNHFLDVRFWEPARTKYAARKPISKILNDNLFILLVMQLLHINKFTQFWSLILDGYRLEHFNSLFCQHP